MGGITGKSCVTLFSLYGGRGGGGGAVEEREGGG